MDHTATPKHNTTKHRDSNYSKHNWNSESFPNHHQQYSTTYYQTLLVTSTNNNHWGDPMITPKPFNTFQVISQNVTTLCTQQDYIQWQAASQAISESKADTIAFQETNLSWNKIHRRCIQQILQQPTGNAILATTNSTEISSNTYQWGGTIQAVIGSWTSCTIANGHHTKGLGWWSFIKI